MGTLTLPVNGPVYVDANALIYRVEQIEPYLTLTQPLWNALRNGTMTIVTSELSVLETSVKPLRIGDMALYGLYQRVLYRVRGLSTLPIDRKILEQAAQLRATTSLKTPDAIHAATALLAECTMFVTNDAAFRRVPGLPVAVLSDISATP